MVNSFKEAIELSLTKWNFIVKNNGSEHAFLENDSLLAVHPELKELIDECGMCDYFRIIPFSNHVYPERFSNSLIDSDWICNRCPLFLMDKSCFRADSKYRIWANENSVENAQAVLNLIIDVKNTLDLFLTLKPGTVNLTDTEIKYRALVNPDDKWNGWAKPFINKSEILRLTEVFSEYNEIEISIDSDDVITIITDEHLTTLKPILFYDEANNTVDYWYNFGELGLVWEFEPENK